MILVNKNATKEKAGAQRQSSQRPIILANKNTIEEKAGTKREDSQSR